MPDPDQPNSQTLCGTFSELTDAQSDQGRAFSAPVSWGCGIPDIDPDGGAEIVYVDGEPTATDA